MRATRPLGIVTALILSVAVSACGGDTDARSDVDAAEDGPAAASTVSADPSDRPSAPEEARSDELLCDVIQDDEALTPAAAEPIEIPGVREANNERRCMRAFGVDMAIEEVRAFYRSTLADRGFEIDHFIEGDGIARGNLSRTLIRATRPGLQVNMTVDEFDPAETPIAEYGVQAKLQINSMGD